MQVIYTLIAILVSHKICNIFTHPNSKIWHHYPHFKIKRVELLPSIRIVLKGKIIHFHHWFNFSVILCLSIFVTGGVLDSWITRGALIGGIIQGLSISSGRHFIYKQWRELPFIFWFPSSSYLSDGLPIPPIVYPKTPIPFLRLNRRLSSNIQLRIFQRQILSLRAWRSAM